MKVEYVSYKAKRVLNIYKHVDFGWFWNRYSDYTPAWSAGSAAIFAIRESPGIYPVIVPMIPTELSR